MTRAQKLKLLKQIKVRQVSLNDLFGLRGYIVLPSWKGPEFIIVNGVEYRRDNMPDKLKLIIESYEQSNENEV